METDLERNEMKRVIQGERKRGEGVIDRCWGGGGKRGMLEGRTGEKRGGEKRSVSVSVELSFLVFLSHWW